MTEISLSDFCQMVADADLSEPAITKKWHRFCEVLSQQSVNDIRHMIIEGALDSLVEFEQMDGFSTEGMRL